MTRRPSARPAGRATDREVGVVAAVLVAGSEKAAAHRLGLSHSTVKHHLANARSKVGAETTAQLVWILAPWLPEAEGPVRRDEWRFWSNSPELASQFVDRDGYPDLGGSGDASREVTVCDTYKSSPDGAPDGAEL